MSEKRTPLTRENCWMTFSEALEQYLVGRNQLHNCRVDGSPDHEEATLNMRLAAEHMDVLTC